MIKETDVGKGVSSFQERVVEKITPVVKETEKQDTVTRKVPIIKQAGICLVSN